MKKANVTIRPAVAADCTRIRELIVELAVFEKASDQVTVSLEDFIRSGFGERPVWWALVAEWPGETADCAPLIIGFALYYIRYSTWKGERLYLEDILVTEAWRGRGVGRRLMDALISIAKARRATGLNWQVLHWNQEAVTFYDGYKPNFDAGWVNVALEISAAAED